MNDFGFWTIEMIFCHVLALNKPFGEILTKWALINKMGIIILIKFIENYLNRFING